MTLYFCIPIWIPSGFGISILPADILVTLALLLYWGDRAKWFLQSFASCQYLTEITSLGNAVLTHNPYRLGHAIYQFRSQGALIGERFNWTVAETRIKRWDTARAARLLDSFNPFPASDGSAGLDVLWEKDPTAPVSRGNSFRRSGRGLCLCNGVGIWFPFISLSKPCMQSKNVSQLPLTFIRDASRKDVFEYAFTTE